LAAWSEDPSYLPQREIQVSVPFRAEAIIKATGENEQPGRGGLGCKREAISEPGGPLRPLFPAREIRENIRSFSERRNKRCDLMQGVVAGSLEDRRAVSATRIQHPVPVAGDLDRYRGDGIVVLAEGMMALGAFATVLG
jgi:hypothetical protein